LSPWCTRSFAFISGALWPTEPIAQDFHGTTIKIAVPLLLHCTVVAPTILFVVKYHTAPDFHNMPQNVWHRLFFAEEPETWYLFALIQWRFWAALLGRIGLVTRLVFSLVLAAIGGYSGVTALMFSRAIVAFPMFIVGQIFPLHAALSRLPQTRISIALGVILLGSLCAVQTCEASRWLMDGIPVHDWAADAPIETVDGVKLVAWRVYWFRGLFRNMLELVKCLVFLLLCCPRSPGFTADFGKHTLYPCLLHFSIVLSCRHWWDGAAEVRSLPMVGLIWISVFAWSLALTVVLASWPVRYAFGIFYEPRWVESFYLNSKLKGETDDDRRTLERSNTAPVPCKDSPTCARC